MGIGFPKNCRHDGCRKAALVQPSPPTGRGATVYEIQKKQTASGVSFAPAPVRASASTRAFLPMPPVPAAGDIRSGRSSCWRSCGERPAELRMIGVPLARTAEVSKAASIRAQCRLPSASHSSSDICWAASASASAAAELAPTNRWMARLKSSGRRLQALRRVRSHHGRRTHRRPHEFSADVGGGESCSHVRA